MRNLIIPSTLALLLIAGTAFAADNMPMHMQMNPGDHMPPASTTMHGPGDWQGTSTPSGMHRPFPTMGGFPGTVLSVGSTSFTMDSPRLDNKHVGTTTLTVDVTASTTYDVASSTASFSSISAGEHVVVFGKVSTSTQTIAASRVIIDEHLKPKGPRGILERILEIFGVHPTVNVQASTSSAAAIEGGGIGGFLHSIFGWL